MGSMQMNQCEAKGERLPNTIFRASFPQEPNRDTSPAEIGRKNWRVNTMMICYRENVLEAITSWVIFLDKTPTVCRCDLQNRVDQSASAHHHEKVLQPVNVK